MRKWLYALLGCLLAVAVIGGCSGSSDTQTSSSGTERHRNGCGGVFRGGLKGHQVRDAE